MSKIYKSIPEGHGECPVCNGTGIGRELDASEKQYSWNKNKTHFDCDNCGGQRMYGKPTGVVQLRKDGTPCKHEYIGRNAGRCYTVYNCVHCNDRYDIDSGD